MSEFESQCDGELLGRYAAVNDQVAFAEIMRRHGGMVHAVCHRILKDHHAAQDVAQVSFMALALHAAQLRREESVGAWLHIVAWRTAVKLRQTDRSRKKREESAMADQECYVQPTTAERQEFRNQLDQALGSLPERYRRPFVLFHLEDNSLEEVALRLGLNVSTVGNRLARAREILRRKLVRRGVSIGSVTALTALLSAEAGAAAFPATFVSATVQAAGLAATGKLAAGVGTGVVSANVAAMTKGALNMLFWSSVKTAAVVVAASVVVVGSGVLVAQEAAQRKAAEQPTATTPRPQADAGAGQNRKENQMTEMFNLRVPAGFRASLGTAAEPYTKTGWAKVIVHEATGIDLVYVPAGSFMMGSPAKEFYAQADQAARKLEKDVDFEVDIKDRHIAFKGNGIDKAAKLLGVDNLYDAGTMHLRRYLDNALKAHHLFHKDKEYLVVGGKVQIVDEHTGRTLAGRRWSDGLHQAIEAKEGVPIEDEARTDETQHRVTLTQGFYLGRHEVTQGQWEKIMGSHPSCFKGPRLPVEQVSWDDGQTFLANAGNGLRLPTEAEWEYACRAGSTSRLEDMGWYGGNSISTTHPVGQKHPNAWGLYDMHGNVWEWCADWRGDYPAGAVTDPVGPVSGSSRVLRGGGWDDDARECRSASRGWDHPRLRDNRVGFRVCLAAVPPVSAR